MKDPSLHIEALFYKERLAKVEREKEHIRGMYKELERKLHEIMRNVTDIVYMLDNNGNIEFINDNIGRLGYSPVELLGINIFELVHPEDRNRAVYHVNERRTGNRKTEEYQLHFLTKDIFAHNDVKQYVLDIDHAKKVSITAEGRYKKFGNNPEDFLGTLGIVKDISLNRLSSLNESDTDSTISIKQKKKKKLTSICSHCKKIRDSVDDWVRLEDYFELYYNLVFSHSICPDCVNDLYERW